ncbi:MAG TPA: hypothetical protein VH502_16075 [Actinoplanes sp.]
MLTAVTRPDISAYTQIPMMPTTSTQVCASPKRDPASDVDTMSPMSTKPPIAVRMPSVTASRRFIRALR